MRKIIAGLLLISTVLVFSSAHAAVKKYGSGEWLGDVTFDQDITVVGNISGATNATQINRGIVPTARLGTGTANNTTVLYGDNTWKQLSGVMNYTDTRMAAGTLTFYDCGSSTCTGYSNASIGFEPSVVIFISGPVGGGLVTNGTGSVGLDTGSVKWCYESKNGGAGGGKLVNTYSFVSLNGAGALGAYGSITAKSATGFNTTWTQSGDDTSQAGTAYIAYR